MLKRLLLVALVVLLAGNAGAQIFTKAQMSKIIRTEYRIKLVDEVFVGEPVNSVAKKSTTIGPGTYALITSPITFNIGDGPQAWTVTITPTGGTTIYDLASNTVPQYLAQDPNTPDNMHAVFMTAPFNDLSFTNRRSKYYFSSDRGTTWSFAGEMNPTNTRSGFPAITVSSEGNALGANHSTTSGNSTTRTLCYYDAAPGLGSFTVLDPGLLPGGQAPIWPRITATGNVSLTQKFVQVSSVNSTSFDSCFKNVGLSLNNSNFSGYSAVENGNTAETYPIAVGSDGRIGIAYIHSDVNANSVNSGKIMFIESTNNGLTFSAPLLIYQPNWNGDSLGGLRGISIAYQGTVPKVAFETIKITQAGSFYPLYYAKIRFWSTNLPGSDPNRSIVLASNFPGGNIWMPQDSIYQGVNDVFGTLCRPSIGVSSDGNGVFVAFMSITNRFLGVTDTTNFKAVYLVGSKDQGLTWGNPQKITPDGPPVRDWTYPSVSKWNDKIGTDYYVNMTILSDSMPGSFVNGTGNGQSLAQYMFVRVKVPQNEVGVKNVGSEVPKEYSLMQNYPNPFNPTTTIKFALPKSSNVTLKVYDITGKVVAVLLNGGAVAQGTYEVRFDASSLSSGIYFYSIEADGFKATKKMMLVK
ncbi:MAG: T9SS type A sorting domain-containing protein [Ignavibacteria bacterium]